jgi:hypothetical protein
MAEKEDALVPKLAEKFALDALVPKFTLGHPLRGQGSEQCLEISLPNPPRGHCCAPRCSSIPNS